MLSWWARCRARNTYTRTSLTSKKPTHPTQGISPFSATQSLRPCIPFQCYPGVVEKKVSPLALSVWLPITRFKQTKLPSLLPFYVSYSHMSHRHNTYHLNHVITKHAVQMRHFKMSNGVSPETHFQDKGKPSHEVWLLAGHHTWSSCNVYPWHIHQ